MNADRELNVSSGNQKTDSSITTTMLFFNLTTLIVFILIDGDDSIMGLNPIFTYIFYSLFVTLGVITALYHLIFFKKFKFIDKLLAVVSIFLYILMFWPQITGYLGMLY